MTATLATPQKMLDYIKRSGALVAAAEKQAAAQAQKEAAVAALIPQVVETMINTGRIPEELRKEAAEKLKDHAATLEVLASVAQRTDDELAHLGGPAKTASDSSARPLPYVGAPRAEDDRESGRALLERILGNR